MTVDVLSGEKLAFGIDDYDELFQAIYESPVEAQPWSTFLQLLADKIPNTAAIVVLRRPEPNSNDSGFIVHTHDEHEAAVEYNTKFHHIDPLFDLPRGQCLSIFDIVDRSSFLKSDYYNGFYRPINVRDAMGIDLDHEESGVCVSFRMAMFAPGEGFTREHKKIMSRLAPHILRAARLHKLALTAEAARSFFSDYISTLDSSAVVIDDSGQVLSINQQAEAQLQTNSYLRLRENKLALETKADTRRLMGMVSEVTAQQSSQPRGLILGMPGASVIFVLRYVPMSGSASYSRPAVFITIHNATSKPLARSELLKELFNFTPAEAKLASILITGKEPKEIASELGVSINTIRTQIQSLFAKTGVKRQVEFINLLWSILT